MTIEFEKKGQKPTHLGIGQCLEINPGSKAKPAINVHVVSEDCIKIFIKDGAEVTHRVFAAEAINSSDAREMLSGTKVTWRPA